HGPRARDVRRARPRRGAPHRRARRRAVRRVLRGGRDRPGRRGELPAHVHDDGRPLRVVQLAGRTILITGATGGLGHALAKAFAARGARLVLTGRRPEVLEELAASVPDAAIAVAD